MLTFPISVVLIQQPGNGYAASVMTVQNQYTVRGWAGSCWEVSTDVPDTWCMVHPSRFTICN